MDNLTKLLKTFKVQDSAGLLAQIRNVVAWRVRKNSEQFDEIRTAPSDIRNGMIQRTLNNLYAEKAKSIDEGYLFPDSILNDDAQFVDVIESEIPDLCCPLDTTTNNAFAESEAKRIVEIQIRRLELLRTIEQYNVIYQNLNQSKSLSGGATLPPTKKEEAIKPKYYALLVYAEMHLLQEIEAFERNENDLLPKKVIEAYAKERFPKISSQRFYQEYKDIVEGTYHSLTNSFPIYKSAIRELSKNNEKLLSAIEKGIR